MNNTLVVGKEYISLMLEHISQIQNWLSYLRFSENLAILLLFIVQSVAIVGAGSGKESVVGIGALSQLINPEHFLSINCAKDIFMEKQEWTILRLQDYKIYFVKTTINEVTTKHGNTNK